MFSLFCHLLKKTFTHFKVEMFPLSVKKKLGENGKRSYKLSSLMNKKHKQKICEIDMRSYKLSNPLYRKHEKINVKIYIKSYKLLKLLHRKYEIYFFEICF